MASFRDGRLTIALATGGTFSGKVTEDTDVGCGGKNEAELIAGLMKWDSATEASANDDPSDNDNTDYGDGLNPHDSQAMDDAHDLPDACPAHWLRPGVNVHEASLDDSSPDTFGEVEFIFGRQARRAGGTV